MIGPLLYIYVNNELLAETSRNSLNYFVHLSGGTGQGLRTSKF